MRAPICCLLLVVALAPGAWAQRAPRLGYVYPAGGRQGTTFEVTLGGQGLTGASAVYFTGRGVEAQVLEVERPLSPKETELLREKVQQLEEERRGAKSAESASDDELGALKEKLAHFGNGRPFNVAIAENVKLRVTMAPDATLGDQEIRLATPGGISNPLVFQVGQLAEHSEPAARGSLKAEIGSPRRARKRGVEDDARDAVRTIALPGVINGQVLAGEVDRWRFTAKAGQRVLFAASARKLIPYIPDAVPGWFQATLTLRDAQGRELAYADDFQFSPDPVVCYKFASDGEYEIAIRDAIHRGREDFVYRVTLGELPFVTSIHPLGAAAGSQCTIQLRGWNLPAAALTLNLRDTPPGLLPLVAVRGQTVSNFVPLAVDSLPEHDEREPNDSAGAAQPLLRPVIVNGRIDRPGDVDVFRLEGRRGDEVVAEVNARRLNSPVDSTVKLTDADGNEIARNDDHEDRGAGLTTHHADSRLQLQLPADGVYFLHLADTQHAGGPEYAYRLRVSAPRPDFALRVVPSSLSGRAGRSVPATVHALRKDGFTGAIAIALRDAPPGFTLQGGSIPEGKEEAKLSITLGEPQSEPLTLAIEGRATIGGAEVVHAAVPADDVQQAFAYRHLVSARELRVAVAGELSASGRVKIANEMPLRIPRGGSVRVQIAAEIGEKARSLELELSDPPAGIVAKTVAISPDGAEIDLISVAEKVIAGEKGTLVLHAFATRRGEDGRPRRIPLGALPSIAFEIVAP